jgi:nucleotide-binding universal stress UspA family protein
MKTILVPLDLSAAAVQVCDAACELARLTGGRLVLLHVVPPPPVVMSEVYAFGAGQLTELQDTAKERAAHKLRALVRHCEKQQVPVRAVQKTGRPAEVILAQAEIRGAGCIVMGTHGHGAVYDLLVGSTTRGVIRRTDCPVMVVPTAKSRRHPARR